jgi:sulfite exporter TauE/SafE
MSTFARLTFSVLAASLVPPLLVVLFLLAAGGVEASADDLLISLAVAWVTGLAHLLVLGVPAFLYLRRNQWLEWRTALVLGLLAGLLPHLLMYPRYLYGYSSSANWHGRHVQLYVDGSPTQYAWLRFGESCILYALVGAATALVLWGVWNWLSSQEAST